MRTIAKTVVTLNDVLFSAQQKTLHLTVRYCLSIKYKASLLLLILVFACLQFVFAQSDTSYSSAPALTNAIASYYRIVGVATGLFNGYEYANYPFRFEEGIAYFGGSDSVKGTVSYKGIVYEEVFMKYDEIKDALIMWYHNDAIQLHNELVDRFVIRGHTFMHLTPGIHVQQNNETAFYELLYAGRSAAYTKTMKSIQQKTDAIEGIIRRVDAKQVFLLRLHGANMTINGKGDLIDAFKDHKGQVRGFIRNNHLNWKNAEEMMARVTAYYDTL